MIRCRVVTRSAAVLAGVALMSCSSDSSPVESDPFPIYVDRADGAFIAELREGDTARRAVIDVLSPITLFDADPTAAVQRRTAAYQLLGHRSPTDPGLIARADFVTTVLEHHPCATATCTVGAPGTPTPIDAVLGADALRSVAVRFEPSLDQLEILPDIAGSGEARDRACDAVVPRPFYGGGTMLIGGTELAFDGLRIALGVCLSPNPSATTPEARGTDAAFVLSTGVGISIIGQARYEAWRQAQGGPPLDELPTATALLPSGPVAGKLARFDRLSIVGSSTAPRGPCREVYAHHLLAERDCEDDDDCPCVDARVCSTPAILELAPAAPIEAVVIDDLHPLLQALRTELRPDQPEIDGILGVDALANTAFDVDYPNNRLLLRCADAGCVSRPAFRDVFDRVTIAQCVAAAPARAR